MRVRERTVVFEREQRMIPPHRLDLPVPGAVPLPGGGRIEARIVERKESAGPWKEVLDADRAGARLCVRTRAAGDRFHPLGAPGSSKLKDFLINSKVPQGMKDRLVLVCNERDIVWVAGLRIHHAYRVREGTARCLVLEAT